MRNIRSEIEHKKLNKMDIPFIIILLGSKTRILNWPKVLVKSDTTMNRQLIIT